MKQFLDFFTAGGLLAFYKLYDIYAATTALIVATACRADLQLGALPESGKNGADHLRAGGRLRRVNHLLS